jgi:hypothetical protein
MKTREGIPEEDVDMMLEGEPFYRNKKAMHLKGRFSSCLSRITFHQTAFYKSYFSVFLSSKVHKDICNSNLAPELTLIFATQGGQHNTEVKCR